MPSDPAKYNAVDTVVETVLDAAAHIRAFYFDERLECYVADHGAWVEYIEP